MAIKGGKSFKLNTPVEIKANGADVASALLKVLAIGVAGGVALLKGGQVLGEKLEEVIEGAQVKVEKLREADREANRDIKSRDIIGDINLDDE